MQKKYSFLIKNIGLFTVGSLGSKIVSFLMLPLYTKLLTTSDYGTVDLLQTTAQLLIPVLLLSIQDATLRFSMDENYKKEDVISTTINIIIKGTMFLIIGMIMLNIFNIIIYPIKYWIFLFFTFLFGAINNCLTVYLKANNKAKTIAIGGIISTFATCFSNIICLVIFKLGIDGYMLSNILGIAIQVLYQYFFGKVYMDVHIYKFNNLSKPMTKYSKPLIANSVSWWINNASDRYILTWVSGIAVNGIYAISYKIPNILAMFQNIFYNAWSISAITEFDEGDKDGFIGNNYILYSLISISICSILISLNIPLAKVLYHREFFEAWKCVPFLLISNVFNGISQFEGALFAATKKTKEVAVTTFCGAIVNIIGNFCFIYYFGTIGAAIATMLGYGITFILRNILLIKLIKMKVDWKKHIITMMLILIQAIIATFNEFYVIQIFIIILIMLVNLKYFKLYFNEIKIKLGLR